MKDVFKDKYQEMIIEAVPKEKDKILNMKNGEQMEINFFQGGGGIITKKNNSWVLEEIPQYGGTPMSTDIFKKNQIDKMIALAYSWI